jgi:hypothetical protein
VGKFLRIYQKIPFADTQDPAWWYYPEGLTEKQQRSKFGFNFGDSEQSPWRWDENEKRPVLYWEKIDADDTTVHSEEKEQEIEFETSEEEKTTPDNE